MQVNASRDFLECLTAPLEMATPAVGGHRFRGLHVDALPSSVLDGGRRVCETKHVPAREWGGDTLSFTSLGAQFRF